MWVESVMASSTSPQIYYVRVRTLFRRLAAPKPEPNFASFRATFQMAYRVCVPERADDLCDVLIRIKAHPLVQAERAESSALIQ